VAYSTVTPFFATQQEIEHSVCDRDSLLRRTIKLLLMETFFPLNQPDENLPDRVRCMTPASMTGVVIAEDLSCVTLIKLTTF